MLTGSHTQRQGKQSPLVFCTNVVEKVRPFCHKLSHEMAPATIIFKQTPWSNLWNGATHPRKKQSRVWSQNSEKQCCCTLLTVLTSMPSDLHLFGLWNTAHQHSGSRGRRETFTGWEHVLLLIGKRILLTKMGTVQKNKCAFINSVVKLCEYSHTKNVQSKK